MSGRTKSVTDNKGQKTSVAYNIDNTVSGISVSNVAPGTAAVAPLSFTYDPHFKRIASRTDGIGTTEFSYHPYAPGNSAYGDGKLASVNGPWTDDTISYVYDKLGRAVSRSINGSANTVSVAYDGLGRVTATTNTLGTFLYDYLPHSNMLASVSSPVAGSTSFSYKSPLEDLRLEGIENRDNLAQLNSKFEYAYDILGRITKWSQGDSTTSRTFDADYDKSNRLTEWVEKLAGGDTGTKWNWRFDRAGNRLNEQMKETLAGTVRRNEYSVNIADQVTATAPGGPLHVHGTLDEQAKITQVKPPPALTDALGRFKAWVDTEFTTGAFVVATDFSNNTTSTWLSVTPQATPSRAFEYDGNGNTVRALTTATDGVTTSEVRFEWDAWNQLTAIVQGNRRSEFTYDGLGRRVRIHEVVNGSTESNRYFIWEGLQIAELRGSSTDPQPYKQYFSQGYYDHDPGQSIFYAKDHLGSVREAFNYDSGTFGKFDYDAYGNVATVEGGYPVSVDMRYTGHYYHQPSGLYLAPYRAYDPKVGKWLSRDPIGHDGGINLYSYVSNEPLLYFDSLGLHKNDKWYGFNNRDFQNWAHTQKQKGCPDFTEEDIKNLYDEWDALGRPSIRSSGQSRLRKVGKKGLLLIPFVGDAIDVYAGYLRNGVSGAVENWTGVADAKAVGQGMHNAAEDRLRKSTPFCTHNDAINQVLKE